MLVSKVTWQKIGQVKAPGRYNYTFGWLTITPADLAICEQFPAASFTLVPHHGSDDEHRLGVFESLPPPAFELDSRLGDQGRSMRQRGQRWRLTLPGLIAAVLLGLLSSLHAAPSCDHFKAAIVEGAAHYGLPAPTFTLVHVNEADANVTNWNIATFDDVRSMISCWQGAVLVFAVNAGDAEIKSSFHFLLLTAIGLHAYGMDWRRALNLRDDMVRAAKTSMTAYAAIDGAKASLIISIANTPGFQIEADD